MSKASMLEQMKSVAERAQGYAADVAAAAAGAIEELDGEKADKAKGVTITVPTTGWGSDSTATYPKYYDIAVTGVTATDRANVDIATASLGIAVSCGMCPTCETLAGKIRLRAVSVPTASMTATYWVEKGA